MTALTPEHAEIGEPLELQGSGFPAGKVARVTFRGALSRPGAQPIQGVVIAAHGRVVSEGQVVVPVDEDLANAFVLHDGEREHTTFQGEVEVSFTPAIAGAAPVYGVLRDAKVDVLPPRRQDARDDARIREGTQVLASAGIRGDSLDAQGVIVREVVAGSAADRLGLAPGDRLLSFNGVAITSIADCAVAPTIADVPIWIRRDGVARDELRTLSIAAPSRVSRNAVLACAALGLFAFILAAFVAFRPLWLAWAVRQLVRVHSRTPLSTVPARAARALSRTELLLGGLLFAVLSAIPFTRYLIVRELDLAVLLAVAIGGSLALAVAERGVPATGYSAAILRWTLAPLPFAQISATAILRFGSFRIEDFARDQGFAPWRWHALESPLSLLCVLIALAGLALPNGGHQPGMLRRLGLLVVHVTVAYTTAILYLGAYRLPVGLEAQPSALVPLLAFLWLSAKGVLLLLTCYVARAILVQLPWRLRRAVAQLWLPAIALGVFGISVALHVWHPPALLQAVAGPATLALLVLFVVRAAVEAYRARREGLNPIA